MKERIIEEMSKPVAWGGSPGLNNRETIGIIVALRKLLFWYFGSRDMGLLFFKIEFYF